MRHIGTLTESSLHAALKQWYSQSGDLIEAEVEGLVIDIAREQNLIEIQTGNFTALRPKLKRLLPDYSIRLVYPVAVEKWIVREDRAGHFMQRRKSPKRGRVEDMFQELVRIPSYLLEPQLAFEVILTRQEEIWRNDGKGSWRRKRWSIHDRRLLGVIEQVEFRCAEDYLSLLPADLTMPFSNRELATTLACRISLAQKMTYTLRRMGVLETVGKAGNANLFQIGAK